MKKILLLGTNINYLSSFEAKLSLRKYGVFISSIHEEIKDISLNIFLNKIKFIIFFLDENISSLETLKNLKESLELDIVIFVIVEKLKDKNLLDSLNIKHYFDLEKYREDEIIEKILKIEKNIYER